MGSVGNLVVLGLMPKAILYLQDAHPELDLRESSKRNYAGVLVRGFSGVGQVSNQDYGCDFTVSLPAKTFELIHLAIPVIEAASPSAPVSTPVRIDVLDSDGSAESTQASLEPS